MSDYKADISKFKTLTEVKRREIEKNPEFETLLEEARAEIAVALQIARMRELRGMTQKQMAEASGLRTNAIGRLEQGNISPTVKTLRKLTGSLNARFIIEPNGEVRMESV